MPCFNSVPTSDTDLERLHAVMHDNVEFDNRDNFDIIQRCIKKLKPHKDDGNYGFKSDHLINGSNKLFIMLSIMFNAMLTHGFNPEDLLLSTIISIPKYNRGSMNSSDNYRGISFSNSICKLYDYEFFYLNMDYSKTGDMQFGFKNNHPTVLCTAVYIEIINHYVNEGSDVYSCAIDASKAFDGVHRGKLFYILFEKKVSYIFLRLISDSYITQKACVT